MLDRMIERLSFGWSMARSSWAVVKAHPKLLVFPVLSGLALAILLATIFLPGGMLAIFGRQGFELGQNVETYGLLALMFLYYFAIWFVMVFFNAALVFTSLRYFETGKASLREGLATAFHRLPQIAGWAAVGATVGVLLHMLTNVLKDKLGFLGSLFGGLLESSWAVLTYFVVPVLVVEGIGPIKAVRRSTEIVKRTWGEALGGEGGLGLLGFLLMLPVFILFAIAAATSPQSVGALGVAGLAASGIYMLAVTVLLMTLSTVLRSAIYVFAVSGAPPKGFEAGALSSTFRQRG